jgi:hypothetical protein
MALCPKSMPRCSALLFLAACGATLCACGSAVETGEIVVNYDHTVDFSQFETFTVLTPELVPNAPEPGEDEEIFNEMVNDLIIAAMTAPPVCMTFIPPEEVTEANQPDLFAGNGLSRTKDEGVVWQCVGGWWWGVWGWFWDPCAWLAPVPVEFEVGSLLIPVGPRPAEGEEPEPVFTGLGQSVLGRGTSIDVKVRNAVSAIFAQWPVQRSCSR